MTGPDRLQLDLADLITAQLTGEVVRKGRSYFLEYGGYVYSRRYLGSTESSAVIALAEFRRAQERYAMLRSLAEHDRLRKHITP